MTPDLARTLGGWLGGLLLVAAAFGATYLTGRMHGRDAERAVWTERQIVAERAARQTEQDLAALAEQSARRIAVKEAALHDQATRQSAAWRALLASLPRCALPAAVGVQLDAAAGLPAATAVAESPDAAADAAALGQLVRLADELDTVRANYAACRITSGRLIEARDWYEAIRERVNRQ